MNQLLQQKIKDLPFSSELTKILLENGLDTLEDLLQVKVFNWHKYPGFNYHHQHEIVKYLEQNNLLGYLKET
jgi:hypothetical protein